MEHSRIEGPRFLLVGRTIKLGLSGRSLYTCLAAVGILLVSRPVNDVESIVSWTNMKTSNCSNVLTYFSSFQDKETDIIGHHLRNSRWRAQSSPQESSQPASYSRMFFCPHFDCGEAMAFLLLSLFVVGMDPHENVVVVGLSATHDCRHRIAFSQAVPEVLSL